MDIIQQWCLDNLDIIYFIYGFGFIVMGITILVHPKKGSEFRIADSLWLLAVFGLAHGINEHLDMWALLKGRYPNVDLLRWFILIVSYVFLFEFGRKVMLLTLEKHSGWRRRLANLLSWWLTPVLGLFILMQGVMSYDFWLTGSIWTRYLFGFGGAFMIGTGLCFYFNDNKEVLEPLSVKKYFLILSLTFYVYGFLGGLVVPRGDFVPASWLNTDLFISTVKVPVQVFRAMCALTAAWAVSGILKIFNWETRKRLEISQSRLRKMIFKVSMMEENERKRIAEVLHDHIGQNLAISKIRLKTLKEDNPALSERLQEAIDLLDDSIQFTRSLTFELSTPVLYQLGIFPALEWLAGQFNNKHGLVTEIFSDSDIYKLSGEKSVILFKTVRELMHNIVKHARATKAEISLKRHAEGLEIIVEDNGVGFDIASMHDKMMTESGAFGIFNIKERIQYLGGTVNIKSEINSGARIEIFVPH